MSEIQIDFVIPYVNGGDQKWIEKKNAYLPANKNVGAEVFLYAK